jgi:hypothetical protein
MAYMMSDLAAGSSAVEQLQKNVAEAPYVKDLTQAAAERKIQEDRLAKQYAPEMMAAKAEEEQMRLQTARLQKLATETQYKADKESTAQLQQWLQTDEGKKASDLDVTKKAASLKMHAGLTEDGAKLYEKAEKIQAQELATQAKQVAQDNDTIAKAAVVLDAVPPEKVDEFFGRLPEEQKKLILKQVGEDNWNKATGEEKKKIVDRLFLNAKGQLTEQLKAIELEKTKLVTKNRLDIENSKEAAAKALQTMKGDTAIDVATIKTESAESIAADKIAGNLKLEQQKNTDKIKQIEATHAAKELELTKKHTDEMDKLKQQSVDKKELENLKSQHQKDLESQKATHTKELEQEKEKAKKELETMREKAKKDLEVIKESGKTARANKAEAGKDSRAVAKTDIKDASFYIKEHDKIIKAGQKEEDDLKAQVNAAEKLMTDSKTASWYEPKAYKEDKRTKAYTAAVNKLNDFRKQQTQREIETFENAPDFPKKEEILRKLKQTLAAVDTPPMDKEPPPAKAEATKPAPAKDVPSNKYTQDNPAKPSSKEEYDKLPPNSYYIQDGVVKRKKG